MRIIVLIVTCSRIDPSWSSFRSPPLLLPVLKFLLERVLPGARADNIFSISRASVALTFHIATARASLVHLHWTTHSNDLATAGLWYKRVLHGTFLYTFYSFESYNKH